jgi:hypothetical protein
VSSLHAEFMDTIVEMFSSDGFVCFISVNSERGHLCGYVLVPTDHPVAGCDVLESPLNEYHVHGGVSESTFFLGDWMIGFDCCHFSDYIPYLHKGDPEREKGRAFVKRHLQSLAKQLRESYIQQA